MRIRGSIVIARPVEEVFDLVADERNEPAYNPHLLRAEKLTPGPIGVGTRWGATVESRGRPLELVVRTDEYVRPTRLGSTTTMPGATIRGVLTFEPDPGGTRMAWSWDLRPHGLLRLAGPLLGPLGRRQERRTWAGLKRYLENGLPT